MIQNSSLQVEEQKLATLVTTAHTERMVLRCHAEWVETISDLNKGAIPETFYVTQNLLKSKLTAPPLIYNISSVM
jgi:hypothetical protein